MNFSERDELPHIPDGSDSRRWQENYFVIAWAIDDNAGVLVHCKRWPSTGEQIARIVAVIDDHVVSRRVVEAIPAEEFTIDGLRLNVKHPFRELELRGSFNGTAGFGPLGFVAWRTDGGVPATVDLVLRSELPPADFTEGFEVLAQSLQPDTAGRQSVTTDIDVEFNPQPGLHAFDSTRVRIGGPRPLDVIGHPAVHLVKYLPGSGPGRFDDNAISRINAPGLTGFGVHEYAGTLTQEQAALLEAAEGNR